MTDGPLLWYLNRGTGFVILGLLTAATVLGVLATGGRAGRGVPRFVTQALHRDLALISLAVLGAHVATAVVDTYVDIRWWQALVPYLGSTYHPVALGLGALALDLVLVVTATSLLRSRLRHRSWRAVHLLAYAAWAVGVAHGLAIGTDVRTGTPWARTTTLVCVVAVLAATALRLARLAVDRVVQRRPATAGSRP